MKNTFDLSPSRKKDHKKSIQKNIKQSELNLNKIKRNFQQNIIPFSLRQGQKNDHQNQMFQHFNDEKVEDQIARESKFSSVESMKPFIFANDSRKDQIHEEKQLYHYQNQNQSNKFSQQFTKTKDFQIYNQQNIQNHSNNQQTIESQENCIQLQIHLTIAKKKYTLKILNHRVNYDLNEMVQRFLIENQISNPNKKNHLKTKKSIISMVQQKLLQRSKQNNEQITRLSEQKNINDQILKQSLKRKKMNSFQNHSSSPKKSKRQNLQQVLPHQQKLNKRVSNHGKYQKPIIKQKSKVNKSPEYNQDQQGCSPSFKSSQYVSTSPNGNLSRFSPQPKHKDNKYQKLISNYYKDKINQSPSVNRDFLEIQTHNAHNNHQLSDNRNINEVKSKNKGQISVEKVNQQEQLQKQEKNLKSVYEKWKQKEKQKQQHKVLDRSFDNALKEKKANNNLSRNNIKIQQRQKSWNKKGQRSNHTNNMQIQNQDKSPRNVEIKGYNQFYLTKTQKKSIDKSNNKNFQKSISNTKNQISILRNDKNEQKSPHKLLNKARAFNDSSYYSHHSPYRQINQKKPQQSVSPLKYEKSNRKNKTANQRQNLKFQQESLAEESVIYEMSPDHFYKQGLLFEAKKKQQIQQKFNQLYPFTTRRTQQNSEVLISQKNSRNSKSKSQSKYFSSHLNNNKSLSIISMEEKQKSILHQRLYHEGKQRNMKKLQVQAKKKIYTIAKTPKSQIQINLMKENLRNIKGLTQQNKANLIQRNIEIKSKVKQKVKVIDQELDKMIKEGKFSQPCQLIRVQKSPFRKTQLY